MHAPASSHTSAVTSIRELSKSHIQCSTHTDKSQGLEAKPWGLSSTIYKRKITNCAGYKESDLPLASLLSFFLLLPFRLALGS